MIKQALNRIRCNEPALRANLAAHGLPSDLANLFLARKAALAAQIDDKQITKEQAEVSVAETQRELTDNLIERRRTNAATYRDFMQTQQTQPQFQLRQPTQTTCNRFGDTVNCTTN